MRTARRLAVLTLAAALLAGCTAATPGDPAPRPTGASTRPSPDPTFSGTHETSAPDGVRLVETTYPSPALHMRRNVVVMLPPGYAAADRRRYPVVVLLHGDPGSPLALIRLGNLLAAPLARGVGQFIGVLPDGNGPVLQRSWYVNLPSQRMGTSVAVDLRRWVSRSFRTDGSYSYAGLSSGGFAAAYLPLLDPQPVHAVCGLSGFYDGFIVPLHGDKAAQQQVSAIAHIQREPVFTLLAYGAADGTTRVQSLRYAAALRAAGKDVLVHAYPGGHVWAVWKPAFVECLRLVVPAR